MTQIKVGVAANAAELKRGGFVDAAAAVNQAKSYSGSHPFVIRVYDEAGDVLESHEHNGDFREQ